MRVFCSNLVFLLGGLLMTLSGFCFAAEESSVSDKLSAEAQSVIDLRKFYTNLQKNKDDSVRLVRFSKPQVTDETLTHLQNFKKIDYLAVVCPQVTDRGIVNIRDLTNLDALMLSESGITDLSLSYLANLTKLQRLYLAQTSITDAGLKQISHLTNLKKLSLGNTGISDAGLKHLKPFAQLEFLYLSNTKVTDQGIEHLTGLKNLRVLFLSGCDISGEGLSALQSLEKLEHLALNETKISDAAIQQLVGQQTTLKHLELYNTLLTDSGFAAIRNKLTDTIIYGSPPNSTGASELVEALENNQQSNSQSSQKLLAPIKQRLAQGEMTPDFQKHVVPLLGRLGCNSRNCHGSFQGQGGFRLSMFGYNFEMDHQNLSERLNLKNPKESLILNKPTSDDEHEGGQRFTQGSWEQKLLRHWIDAGAKNITQKPPKFERLIVSPQEIVFKKKGETIQLNVIALWSDGTQEDVTCLTRFESKNDSVADVSADGLISSQGEGDTYIVSFYDNGIYSTQAILPYASENRETTPAIPASTPIDQFVLAKLKKLNLQPSPLCSDEVFLRRVSIDIAGTLPTPEEIQQFLSDSSSDKRAKKIDQLLQSSAYVSWWTTRLCDLTGSNAGYLGGTEMAQPVALQWNRWMNRRVSENAGWDKIASAIILARSRPPGQPYESFIQEQSSFTGKDNVADFADVADNMPHYWYRDNMKRPEDKTLAFGYTFLGMRLDCAQCHKHPFDQWSKNDFQLFTQFFTRIKAGIPPEAAALHEETRNMLAVPVKLDTAALRRQSYMRIAAEGRNIPWKEVYLDPPPGKPQIAKLLGGVEVDISSLDDPRQLLMHWVLNEPNRYFAKAFVNRIWSNYFNVGIINPPDDLNLANPPSNKALFNYLVTGFIESGYDIKWLHRTIANSRTYQLSWKSNSTNKADTRNFSHAVLRRLPAEVAIDALLQATVNDAGMERVHTAAHVDGRKIGQHPKSSQTRSIDYSLLVFGKPLRSTNCDCERQSDPTLLQALYLRNDEETHENLTRVDGWLVQIQKQKPDLTQFESLVETAYLRTLSRKPSDQELVDCKDYLKKTGNISEALHDVLWALVNTQEFITNH